MPTDLDPYGWTVPEDTDPLKDGAAAIRELAGDIAASLPIIQTGQASTNHAGSAFGTTAVTFPEPFPHKPAVIALGMGSYAFAYVQAGPTTTGVTLGTWDQRGPYTGSKSLTWVAVGYRDGPATQALPFETRPATEPEPAPAPVEPPMPATDDEVSSP